MTAPLPDNLKWALEQCDGYMDLSMWEAASALLKGIPEEFNHHPKMQTLLLRRAIHKGDWPAAASLADDLHRAEPDSVQHWISLAYALRRKQGIQAARKVLIKSLEKFPADPIVGYNLACYDCVEGRHEAAVQRLTHILEMHPGILQLIEKDEDLHAVREFFDEDLV